MWRSGSFVGNIKVLPEVGSLILRYVQRKKPKTENNWIGPYVVLKQIGSKMVEALNLETNRLSVIHLNDLKEYFRPNTSEWNINSRFLREYCDRLEIDISEFVRPDLNVNWKNKYIFVDINNCAALEDIILKSLKDLLSKLLLVVPEFKERNFWEFIKLFLHKNVFIDMSRDSDLYLSGEDAIGLRIWNSMIGCLDRNSLFKIAKNNTELVKLLREDLDSGEVLECDGVEGGRRYIRLGCMLFTI
jgi:hypothetical protein